MGFTEILDKYRTERYSKSDMGAKFEELMARFLMVDPVYAPKLEWAKLWRDFPARQEMGGHDTGIDIVAKTKTGEYWAIQCKLYREGNRVSKKDLDTFISTSGRKFTDDNGKETSFSERFIFVTNNDWSSNAESVTDKQTIPVNMVSLSMLMEAAVDWDAIEQGAHGESARLKKHELRDHQKEALSLAVEHFKTNDRGSMIMACGTGKTFTSLKIAEALTGSKDEGLVLFLAPSIALIGQTLREWTANSKNDLNTICVCSDPKVSKKYSNDDLGERVEDLGAPATTDPEKIISQYRSGDGLTVIFSTYQSIDAVMEAQRSGLPSFDIIVCDEAHRTTGATLTGTDESAFVRVHSNSNIKGKKRLYMTATPRIYGSKGKEKAQSESVVLCSMDDESLYGKEFYKIGFGRAVELELLSDYKVLILTTKESNVPDIIKKQWNPNDKEIDVDTDSKVWGSMNALAKNLAYDETLKNTDPGKMRSAVAFCRTIKRSKYVRDRFNAMAQTIMRPLDVRFEHVDGEMNAIERDRLMNWLKDDSGEKKMCKALTNVRCLSEGVDVPALDAVMFMDSKGSLVDIVQSVGRVMRKAPGKMYGYIIVPIVVPEDGDPEDALDDNERYKVVWDVLRALRSHDERLDAEINTLQYRKIQAPKNGDNHVHIARPYGDNRTEIEFEGQYTLDDFGNALLARLVLKVGDRQYIENWAKDIAKIMPDLTDRLTQICKHEEHGYKQYQPAFKRYLKGLRACVNDNVTEEDAINMLAQQIVTKPIFSALFGNDTFVKQNSVSQTIDAMLDEIDAKDGLKGIDLEDFYQNVERTLSKIDTNAGKQKVIVSLYEKFFKNAFPKDQSINGVVYTPQEIVDFIINSAAEVLKQEFNIDINDENVNILDPFTGTGTFIARLMETGIINKKDLERKYKNELFANEITLLAYYIAAVNIENTFSRVTESTEYVPFNHILLTDTFNIEEICKGHQASMDDEVFFKRNMGRIREEAKTPITIIVGNPPYGATQKSANDDAKKRTYGNGVDKAIEEKYLDNSLFSGKKGNVNSVYDNYIRAFRWSTDRIGDNDGVIAFITPNGWLSGSAFEGFRKRIEREFEKIYVFNLRGDATTQGEMRRNEGDGIFGDGSRVGISIALFVKRKGFKGKAKVLYAKTEDKMKRQSKLDLLDKNVSFAKMEEDKLLTTLNIKENGDWIVERNEIFQTLIPIAGDTYKKFEKYEGHAIFVGYTQSYQTNRDAWAYNYSKNAVEENMFSLINEYNKQIVEGKQNINKKKIAWSTDLNARYNKNKTLTFKPDNIGVTQYRPFVKIYSYCELNGDIGFRYQLNKIFPYNDVENLLICVSSVGDKKRFSCLITNQMTDLHIVGTTQCFPLYWHEDTNEKRTQMKVRSIDGTSGGLIKHDGISDYALKTVRNKYGNEVAKEDIFFYIYGYLHSPEYRNMFASDLQLSLPRISFVEDKNDFFAFSEAGRQLSELHLNYENAEPPEGITFKGNVKMEELLKNDSLCRVTKMRLDSEERKLVYNQHLTIENIPEEAFEYIVNGRSALGWIVEQYRYSVDKDSGIVNDPNEYGGGKCILNLVQSIISVSVKTMKIIKNLPKLNLT